MGEAHGSHGCKATEGRVREGNNYWQYLGGVGGGGGGGEAGSVWGGGGGGGKRVELFGGGGGGGELSCLGGGGKLPLCPHPSP